MFNLLLIACVALGNNTPLCIGDSLMQQAGVEIQQAKVLAYSGSSISNPSIHNWSKIKLDPNTPTVILLGTNDAQAIIPHSKFGTEEWKELYSNKISELMSQSTSGNLMWIIPGRTGSKWLDKRLDIVREILISRAGKYNVKVLDMRVMFNEQDKHNPYYHSGDKVHLNSRGIKLISSEINTFIKSK